MDIAALSVLMSQGQVQQQAGVSVMKMAMNVAETQGNMMTDLLDETAKSLGVNVERTRVISMMLVSFITASVICFTGTIGFIGLVAPHITRMAIGGDHRFLLPASALVGALLLLGADTLARTILAPVILPVGIMTAFLGVPFFVYLFMRRKREFW